MEWTNEKVIKLIESYRDSPVLWDSRLEGYKDRKQRTQALGEIAITFGVGKEEIERKIKNLVCHFSRELKKEREGTKSSAGINGVYKSKWFCYKNMHFLNGRNRSTRLKERNTQDLTKFEREVTQDSDQIQGALEHSDSTSMASGKGKKRVINPTQPQDTNNPHQSSTEEVPPPTNDIQVHKAFKDQYTAFGEQVGMRIRDLPSPQAKKIVKYLVSTILFEAEMGKYDQANPFPKSNAQPIYHLPQFSQPPFYSPTGPIPGYNQPQQQVKKPSSDVEYDDGDSSDSN